MELYIEKIDQITAVEIVGEIDSITAPEVQNQVLPLAETGSKILLDMSRVTYMSSAGLRTLLLLYRKINENVGKIVIAGLSEEVRDIMAITGFLDFFAIAETRSDGLQVLRT